MFLKYSLILCCLFSLSISATTPPVPDHRVPKILALSACLGAALSYMRHPKEHALVLFRGILIPPTVMLLGLIVGGAIRPIHNLMTY